MHGRLEQPARLVAFPALEGGDAVVEQFLGFAQPFGERRSGALDIGARPRVAAIQEQCARPDVDRLFVLGREVVIEADQQQLLDLRVAFRAGRAVRGRATGRCEADQT
jgi:hypothetical protein